MLCPGCVAHGTPQTQRAYDLFKATDLQVIGLHTVFEHHAAMMPVSLEAFIHEYRLTFPIGVDAAGDGTPLPITMSRYGMQGTPTSILISRDGRVIHRLRSAERHGAWRHDRSRTCGRTDLRRQGVTTTQQNPAPDSTPVRAFGIGFT